MKKLKVKLPEGKTEVLTREQLRYVMGGEDGDDNCQQVGSECRANLNCCTTLKCHVEDNKCHIVS